MPGECPAFLLHFALGKTSPMWLLLRLVIFCAVLFRRRIHAWFPQTPAGTIDGLPYLLRLQRSGQSKWVRERPIRRFKLSLGLPLPVRFRFSRENALDRLFTRLGLSEEFQTGDASFDHQVYIACDHPALLHHLQRDVGFRRLVQQAMTSGYDRISGDGTMLWIERPANGEPTHDDLRLLADLRGALLTVRKEAWYSVDPFVHRVLLMETLIWTCAGYALGALVDPLVFDFHHVDPVHLGVLGTFTAGVLFLGLVTASFFLLRGSSQGHRVILESALVLGLSLPFAGPLLLSDVNRHLDFGTVTTVSREIVNMEVHTSQRSTRRGSSRSTKFHLICNGPGEVSGVQLPERISVSQQLYNKARVGGQLVCQVHRGALGLPWYDHFEVR